MDLEEFYEGDERRRASAEVEYGREWHDARGARYELSWVEATGELYAMREPDSEGALVDPFGDWVAASLPDQALTVRVLGRVMGRDALALVMDGWQEAMGRPDSIRWTLEGLHRVGARGPEEPAPPEAGPAR